MSRRRAIATLVLTLASYSTAAWAATPPARHPTRPERSPQASARPRNPLPDSVLAVIDGDRVVGVAGFAHGWQQVKPPARPDSLTPQGARQFLDLLIQKELLARAASREKWDWTDRERAQFVGMRDHMVIQAMLDSCVDATRKQLAARGIHTRGTDTLGVMSRDTAMVRLHATFDDAVCELLARAWAALPRPSRDSSIFAQLRVMGQMPAVAPADTNKVVARSIEGDYRVADMLHNWYLLNPMYRPRIQSASQIRDVAKNGLFERMLRREAARRHVEQTPEIAEALARQRELTDVTHFVDREIGTLDADSLTLRAYFRAHPELWRLPLRLRYARLVLQDAEAANRVVTQLHDAREADSLLAQAHRAGTNWENEVSQESDSVLFGRLMSSGVGSVIGPEPVENGAGWAVTRVVAVIPGRDRSFDEVRQLVEHAYTQDESERRMRALLAKLQKGADVRINDRALAQLVATPPPGLVGARR